MNIAMFFEFPGILITIGVILLLISIIIIIVAYKSEEKDVDASKLSVNSISTLDEIDAAVDDSAELKDNKSFENDKNDDIEKPSKEDIVSKDNKKEELEKEDEVIEEEKTKIFKPIDFNVVEDDEINEKDNVKVMGIKDMIDDINKVDDKNVTDEAIDIFSDEFSLNDEENKSFDENKEEIKKELKQEKKQDENEDEEIELL